VGHQEKHAEGWAALKSNGFTPRNFAYGVDTRCFDLLMLNASDYLLIRPEMAGEKQEVRYNGLHGEDSGKKYRSQCSQNAGTRGAAQPGNGLGQV
jgi:hypothetical protein